LTSIVPDKRKHFNAKKMGGSLEAFKLFTASEKKRQDRANQRINPPSNVPVESEASSNETSTASPPPSESSASTTSPPIPESENGMKLCVGSVENYTRRQQSSRELEERLATLRKKDD
jgi:hypothetical protein